MHDYQYIRSYYGMALFYCIDKQNFSDCGIVECVEFDVCVSGFFCLSSIWMINKCLSSKSTFLNFYIYILDRKFIKMVNYNSKTDKNAQNFSHALKFRNCWLFFSFKIPNRRDLSRRWFFQMWNQSIYKLCKILYWLRIRRL